MSAIMPSDDGKSQKRCDDCGYVFDGDRVFECERCHIINTCMSCVGTMHKVGGGHYDTLCKKCWKKCSALIDQEIAKGDGR